MNKIFGLIAISVSLVACKYNQIEEPPIKDINQVIDATAKVITIEQLKSLYTGKSTTIVDNVVIEAFVSSDDTDGNFYKTMTVQDQTSGIEIKLGMPNISTLYPQGCKVRVKCQGLTLGRYGDQINMGYNPTDKYETSFYPESNVTAIVQKIENAKPLDPIVISSYSQINQSMQGKLVKLEGVEFSSEDVNSTIADLSKRNTKNPMKSTKLLFPDNNKVEVRTSAYARFANAKIPNESGSVVGVLSFFRGSPQLTICKISDVQLNKPRF